MSRVLVGMFGGLVLAVMMAVLAPNPTLALECGRNRSHNSFLGKRWYSDQLLYSTHIIEENKWFRTAAADVYFPARASLKGNITYIELLDQQKDGKGGCGFIRNGGPGYNYTSIHFKSSGWNEGINFVLRIYGFPSRRR